MVWTIFFKKQKEGKVSTQGEFLNCSYGAVVWSSIIVTSVQMCQLTQYMKRQIVRYIGKEENPNGVSWNRSKLYHTQCVSGRIFIKKWDMCEIRRSHKSTDYYFLSEMLDMST
jgi:hypothetical protein